MSKEEIAEEKSMGGNQADASEPKSDPEQEVVQKKEEAQIPYSKYKKIKDEMRELASWKEAEEQKKREEQEQALISEKKYEELISNLKEENARLKSGNSELSQMHKQKLLDLEIDKLVFAEASKHGANDVSDIQRFIDRSSLDVDYNDETGQMKVSGVDDVINELKQSKPYLFSSGQVQNKVENGKPNIAKADDDHLPANMTRKRNTIHNTAMNMLKMARG